ncbi:ATP-binding protein [Sulfitobacter marinus]|nr:ATP-binding protein [Sulfitobacter marinus]
MAVIVIGSVSGIGYTIIKLDRDSHLASVKRDVENGLYATAEQVQQRFFETVLTAKRIENILSISGGAVDTQVVNIVTKLQKDSPTIVAVALAPGLEVTHSFPLSDDETAIGLKYWQVPEQMASVARAYRGQSAVVDGPLSLLGGEMGYILRYPVFLPLPDRDRDRFWGIISIAIRADSLFSSERHDFGDASKYLFELNEIPASGVPVATAGNGNQSWRFEPVVVDFSMLGNRWQALARPTAGWPSYSPQSSYLVAFSLFSAVVLLVVLSAYRRLALKKDDAHALLAEAVGCISEGFIAFDDKERLMIVNQKYLDYHANIADLVVPGMTMDELVRIAATHQAAPFVPEDREAWIADRMENFRNPGESFLQQISDDLWLKVTEAKTPHGYTVGIWTDVSAEKHAQGVAEAADREKTDFLNNVSHELRTPLTVIFGRATFMRNSERLPQSKKLTKAISADGPPTPAVTTAINKYQDFISEQGAGIADSAQHMIRLVEDLLDWTKVARGKLELDMQLLQLDELAASVVEDLQPNAEAKGLDLSYAGDSSAEAMADKVRLKQILYNLINNAIKFTDKGSIHLEMTRENGQIVFNVTDTGHGISEENLERVFQRFQQVDGSMSRKSGGLGLGLAISEQLAALHGGTLSLTSKIGRGSTFTLKMPSSERADQGSEGAGQTSITIENVA